MRKIAIPFLAVAGLVATAATSHAQSIGVEIDSDGPAYGYTSFGYGPGYYGDRYYGYRAAAPARRYYYGERSYGYRSDAPVTVQERGTSGGCGTYFYWNGDRCVDARNK
jgi:hypothetical protein